MKTIKIQEERDGVRPFSIRHNNLMAFGNAVQFHSGRGMEWGIDWTCPFPTDELTEHYEGEILRTIEDPPSTELITDELS